MQTRLDNRQDAKIARQNLLRLHSAHVLLVLSWRPWRLGG